jgi:hypothetical protein
VLSLLHAKVLQTCRGKAFLTWLLLLLLQHRTSASAAMSPAMSCGVASACLSTKVLTASLLRDSAFNLRKAALVSS